MLAGWRRHSQGRAHTKRQIFFIKPSSSSLLGSIRCVHFVCAETKSNKFCCRCFIKCKCITFKTKQFFFSFVHLSERMKNRCIDIIIDVNLTQANMEDDEGISCAGELVRFSFFIKRMEQMGCYTSSLEGGQKLCRGRMMCMESSFAYYY